MYRDISNIYRGVSNRESRCSPRQSIYLVKIINYLEDNEWCWWITLLIFDDYLKDPQWVHTATILSKSSSRYILFVYALHAIMENRTICLTIIFSLDIFLYGYIGFHNYFSESQGFAVIHVRMQLYTHAIIHAFYSFKSNPFYSSESKW